MNLVRPRIMRLCAVSFAAWMTIGAPLVAADAGAVPVGVTAVPEPSVLLTLTGGAAVLIALQRRRRW